MGKAHLLIGERKKKIMEALDRTRKMHEHRNKCPLLKMLWDRDMIRMKYNSLKDSTERQIKTNREAYRLRNQKYGT